jgi:predicted MFS family arabinose efflux permease
MKESPTKAAVLKIMLLTGIVGFFADMAFEGSRSIAGPYLALLGASAVAVALISGFGELLGCGLRLVVGRQGNYVEHFWPITIFGYVIQVLPVPLLALAGNWPTAALAIIIGQVGRVICNPARDAMLSRSAREARNRWSFGIRAALNQAGTLFGPLLVAVVLIWRGQYRIAFVVLLIPALVTLCALLVARLTSPRPEWLKPPSPDLRSSGLPGTFWVSLQGAMLVAVGFADFPFIAYHFARTSTVSSALIPVFYVVAMGVSGVGSLLCGCLFDRFGVAVLVPLTLLSALFAPLVFLGNSWLALVGVVLWGLGMGVQESVIPAAVIAMVLVQRRVSAYGLYTLSYGVFWFFGSALLGVLYSKSAGEMVAFSLLIELAAALLFLVLSRQPRV